MTQPVPFQPSDGGVIRLENVCKDYPIGSQTVHALVEINLTFRAGEFWAIMGHSGSGKSTMLNLLGCLDRPTSGRYLLQERDVARLDDDALSRLRLDHLGFIFQSFNLIAQLTVKANIELPLYYHGWTAARSGARAEELAERVGLADRLEHRPTELSGGQQQRVAIARALANDPQVLLADEPTGNLDTQTGAQIIDILHELHDQGKTIVVVTHEAEIAAHADQCVHLRDGRIERIEEKA